MIRKRASTEALIVSIKNIPDTIRLPTYNALQPRNRRREYMERRHVFILVRRRQRHYGIHKEI
jgi:hypothetical protein